MTPGRLWTSPSSAARYPVEWTIRVPRESLDLHVTPVLDAQELSGARSGVSYWEGAVDVGGADAGRPVTGRGYLEMTGYAGRALGELLNPPSPPAPRKAP
jgi:predicted secreted hydrolase